jgi:hypothetical protein
MQIQKQCENCSRDDACGVCLCSMISLCSACAVSHAGVKAGTWHSVEPLAAEMFLESLEDREDYFRRKEVVNQLTTSIEKEIKKLNTFRHQIISTKHRILENLEAVISTQLEQITQADECLNAILQELDLCRYFKNLRHNNLVHDLVIKSAQLERPKLNIVTTNISTERVITELNSMIQFNFSLANSVTSIKTPNPELYYFKPEVPEITFISFSSDSVFTSTHPLSRSFHEMAAWSKVDEDHVIITGGKKGSIISRDVFLIHLKDLTVVQLKPMIRNRYLHGIISTSKYLLIFGGMHKSSLKECEALNLSNYTWDTIPDMHSPRHGFTATHYNSLIFLAGGRGNSSIELFSPETHTFTKLAVSLPKSINCSTAVCVDEGVLIFSGDNLYMYSIQDSLLDLGTIDYNVWWSNTPVVCYSHRLMGLHGNNCTMWTWDMSQDDKARVVKL